MQSTVHVSIESDEYKVITAKCAGETAADQNIYKALRMLLDKMEQKDVFKASPKQNVEAKTDQSPPQTFGKRGRG